MTTSISAIVTVIEGLPIPSPGDSQKIEALVRHSLVAEAQTGDWEISIALMSDDDVRRLHRDFMGLDSMTDILTFPTEGNGRGGDIAISVERVVEQAPEFGMTAWEELCFVCVHGVLHLTGWDDGDDEARERMLARQAEIIEDWRQS